MLRRILGRRLIALLGSLTLISGIFLAVSPSALATTYCNYFNGTPVGSCIYYANGAVNAEGVNNVGHGYCLWKAHEQETYPGGNFNTPDHSNWCGNPRAILMGAWAGHGTYCAILWGNSNDGRGWWQVAKVCHNY